MHRIDTATRQIDKFGAGKHGFTAGDFLLGVPPTSGSADWHDTIQEELLSIVEGMGIAPSKPANTQVKSALNRLLTEMALDNWNPRTSVLSTTPAAARACLVTTDFVLVGGDGGYLTRSFSGGSWITTTSNFASEAIVKMYTGNNVHVALGGTGVGSARISTSPDGITWTSRSSAAGNALYCGGYGGSIHVIGGGITGNPALQSSSDNGATWQSRTSQFTNGLGFIYDVAFGGGVWVIVGASGQASSSTDGITWVARTSQFGASLCSRVLYANGVWLIVGDAGKISRSTNGTSWTAITGPFGSSNIAHITYGNGVFLIGAADGRTAVSSDGTSWTLTTIPTVAGDAVSLVRFAGGVFFVSINRTADTNFDIYTSYDATTWRKRDTTAEQPTDVVFHKNCFVISCTSGAILQSLIARGIA